MLTRRTPMSRGKAPPRREAKQIAYIARPREVARATVTIPMSEPRPKDGAIPEHAAYMAAVRRMPCARCGIEGFTQFCHSDEGKGMALKTDVRRGWPGCGPHPNPLDPSGPMLAGCHEFVGRSMPRGERRVFEAAQGTFTRSRIRESGQWPKSLPPWPGDQLEQEAS